LAQAQPEGLTRRLLLGAGAAAAAASPARAADPVRIEGRLVQGGYAFGHTNPGAEVFLNGERVGLASRGGVFILGFDRDEAPTARLEVRHRGGVFTRTLAIARGTFGVQRVDGVPQDTVTPTDPALLERIRREAEMKAEGYASIAPTDDFAEGFRWPLDAFRISSRFGNQRILNGVPNRPHYGIDLASPAGTPIKAAATGLVVLAHARMHFEGGLTLIDHGQGLVGAYLHQSKILVKPGDRVLKGQRIGAVGMTGRATGPHLCWRLKWRGRNLDPSLLVATPVPA